MSQEVDTIGLVRDYLSHNLEASMSAANFLVSIQRQENQGWQGNIQWLDTGKTVHFRSELEMLLLIEEATRMTQPKEQKRSWDKSETLRVLKNSL